MRQAGWPLAAILVACAGGPSQVSVPLTVALAESGCVVRLENRTYSLPAENAAVEAHLARLKERERGVRIEVEGDAPYRCVGSTVFAAQRIGLRVSLTAEPPR